MRKHWLRSLGFVLVLGCASLTLHAQRGGRGGPPGFREGVDCYCKAGGAECLFGTAEGCEIWCVEALCSCRGATCPFGFPKAAKCRCKPRPNP